MSEAGNAVKKPAAARDNIPSTAAGRVSELRVSAHLMTLDTGMFCVFHAPGGSTVDDGSGLPGVRISLPPAPSGGADTVRISTFRSDGWLDFSDGAALVRVEHGPAQILVTVYQSMAASAETAPRLQVLRLTPDAAAPGQAAGPVLTASRGTPVPASADIVAHIQRTGDVAGQFGVWTGTRGSGSGSRALRSRRRRGSRRRTLSTRRCWGAGGCHRGSRAANSAAAVAWRCPCSA